MRLQPPFRVAPPGVQLVELADAKRHCRIDHADDDALVTAAIAAATGWLDGWAGVLGRCLVNQQWRQLADGFPAGPLLPLPFPDVTAVEVKYRDAADVERTFAAAGYHLISTPVGSCLELADGAAWPATAARPDAVTVTLTAGYGELAADVPQPIRSAALLMVGDLVRNREAQVSEKMRDNPLLMTLIAPFRRVSV